MVLASAAAFFMMVCCASGNVCEGSSATRSKAALYDRVPRGFIEEPESAEADPTGVADFSVFRNMGHPRLLMNASDFSGLKRKVTKEAASNVTLGHLHTMLMTIADESVDSGTEIEYKLDAAGKRLLHRSREALRRIGSCAYAYRMTGHTKYLDRAVRDLETVVAFKDWNPSHFLDVGEMSLAVALGYDWLYYKLPYDLRVEVRKALLERAVVAVRGHSSNTAVSNWNQVCYGGTLAAAIAVYGKEKTQCGGLINDVVANNGKVVRELYDPDGVYPEGYSYWSYGTGYQAVIFTLLEKAFGTLYGMDFSVGLAKTPEWMLMMVGVGNRSYCYGDSSGETAVPKSAMWWFARRYGDPSLLRQEFYQMSIGRYKTTMAEMRFLPMTIACANDIENLDEAFAGANPVASDTRASAVPGVCVSAIPEKTAGSSSSGFFSGIAGEVPLVLVRGDWSNTDSDRYLGVKGGRARQSHGHMDAGSFVYDALGCRWSEDVQRPGYAAIENALKAAGGKYWSLGQNSLRWQVWQLNNRGHSTLTINDRDFIADGFVPVEEVYDDDAAKGAKLNMTPVFGDQVESARRTVVLASDGNLYVTDEITARPDLAAAIQWRMVTKASVKTLPGMEKLTQNGKTLCLKASSSNPSVTPEYTVWEARGTNAWDTPCVGMTVAGFTATVPKGETVSFVTVLSAGPEQ